MNVTHANGFLNGDDDGGGGGGDGDAGGDVGGDVDVMLDDDVVLCLRMFEYPILVSLVLPYSFRCDAYVLLIHQTYRLLPILSHIFQNVDQHDSIHPLATFQTVNEHLQHKKRKGTAQSEQKEYKSTKQCFLTMFMPYIQFIV